ncbi:alpha/beta fold hydrolase [Leptolyngbya sp. FACHB-261]|uniref:alpha/beta fold hydrolase n=1 Tax=Leptolyngbya sp. FACHB-261 TaxID=2692806 RepID=UPI0016834942|nr:alpha/beta hydrolase [Leptolyngbya sp. FACHB-261]MBD2100801.1 alpha/beta hydrolase [Leptolyngbya sp. FACHB-261]
MFADFLPPQVNALIEPTSIALAQNIERQLISTPLSPQPIATSYVRQGKAGTPVPPILLLHGFDSSVFEFRRLLPLLATQAETWALDLLGFGFTERLAGIPFGPTAIKTHLYQAWQTLIGQPVTLVGVSMGGAAAIDLAISYPEVVQNLVLIGSAGYSSGPVMGRFLVPPLDVWAAEFLRSPRVRDQVSRTAYYDPSFASADAALCAALHLEMPGWREALIAFTKSGGYRAFGNKLAQLTQPTLILWGDSDRILGTGDASRLQQAIAHSKLVWVKNCGHVPHLEQPQFTAEQILAFRSTSGS